MAFSVWLGLERQRSIRALPSDPPGSVAVVTVNWNTLAYLKVFVEMVRRWSSQIGPVTLHGSLTGGRRPCLASTAFSCALSP
jgi:hypothetical protein